MSNNLESLSQMSVVVADTADFGLLSKWQPQDATTNPSLILAGAKTASHQVLLDRAISRALAAARVPTAQFSTVMDLALEFLLVEFGKEILKRIPGKVSVEVDARLSFDTQGSIRKARRIVSLFENDGIPRSRLYIKLAATWEGITAARVLEAEGISCNLTLLFSFAQAVACAQSGVSLISPFVGRILDWFKKNTKGGGPHNFDGAADPGVKSVRRIYRYYKRYGYKTIVMGASFRNVGEIKALAGVDKITVSPKLLDELKSTSGSLTRVLAPEENNNSNNKEDDVEPKWPKLTRAQYELAHNSDAMAGEKLAEGIRNFSKDTVTLESMIAKMIIAKRSKL